MQNQFFKFKVILTSLLMLALFYSSSSVLGSDKYRKRAAYKGWKEENSKEVYRREKYSDDEGHNKKDKRYYSRRKYNRSYNKGHRHYYRNGKWYRPGWFGLSIFVSTLVIGAMIDDLPPKHTTIVVQGTEYYHDDRYYYRPLAEGGYIVVSEPIIVQSRGQIHETSTVNIPNSNFGYTSVILRKSGNGFVGPQDEYYPSYPSVEQLKNMYGN